MILFCWTNHHRHLSALNLRHSFNFSRPFFFDIMLHSLRPKYVEEQGAQKLPPPYDMWEKRMTPAGVPYFANSQTKTTSWADPRSQILNQSLQLQQLQQQQQFVAPQIVVAGGQMLPVVYGGGQIIPQGGQQMTA